MAKRIELPSQNLPNEKPFDTNQDGKVDYDELKKLMGSISGDLKDMKASELQLLSMKIDQLISQL